MATLKKYYWLIIIFAVCLMVYYWDDIEKALKGNQQNAKPQAKQNMSPGYVVVSQSGIDMKKTLYAGMPKCEEVKQLQIWLKQFGYDLGKSGPNKDGIDGDFGQKTSNALGKATNGTIMITLEQFQAYVLEGKIVNYWGYTGSQTNTMPVDTLPYQITASDSF